MNLDFLSSAGGLQINEINFSMLFKTLFIVLIVDMSSLVLSSSLMVDGRLKKAKRRLGSV